MAYKLLDAAQDRWHRIVPLVRAGAICIDGKLRERRAPADPTTGSVAA